VRDFAARAERNGLGFLGECEFASMILDNYGAEVAQQVRARSGNALVESEQYLDLLSGRTFRQTLLIGAERMGSVNRAVGPERLESLHILTQAGMRLERSADKIVITDGSGRSLTTASAAVGDGLERLINRFPSSSSLDELAETLAGKDRDADRELLRDALYRMLLIGMITVSSEPVRAGTGGGKKPKAIEIARVDASEGGQSTTNLRHEPVALDPACRALLPVMDGSLNHAALAKRLADEALAGRLGFSRDGDVVTGAADIGAVAAQHLPAMLAALANSGLLQD
jgi:methyltransferase-like protein